jgi:uncharacterized membrane protein YhaH (DUF805 family)
MTETTQKTQKSTKPVEEKLDALVLIKVWFEGWKKTFSLQGRSSRFELWTFVLLNSILAIIAQLRCSYIMSTRFITDAHAKGYSLNQIENSIIVAEVVFTIATLLPLIPTFSMLIRRMHDLGELAWKRYLEPIFMAFTTIGILGYAQLSFDSESLAYLSMIISVCIITLLYSAMFYSTKFLVKTLFYIGDSKKNEYGKAMYKDAMHEEQALNFICLYALFALTIGALYLAVGLL